jgi:hypothetical protein
MNMSPITFPQPNSKAYERTDTASPSEARRSGASALFTLPELATESNVSRRFLEMEISRGRLVAVRMSTRVLRVRSTDWDRYLSNCTT